MIATLVLPDLQVVRKYDGNDAGGFKALMTSMAPPQAPLALDGRHLDSLTNAEIIVLQRYRSGRRKDGLPWISVGFKTDAIDPWAWLQAPTQDAADAMLKASGAMVRVRAYE